jgi:hypothetical protein
VPKGARRPRACRVVEGAGPTSPCPTALNAPITVDDDASPRPAWFRLGSRGGLTMAVPGKSTARRAPMSSVLAQIASARADLPVRSRMAGAIMSLFVVGGKRIGRQLTSSDRMMPAGWSSAGSEGPSVGQGARARAERQRNISPPRSTARIAHVSQLYRPCIAHVAIGTRAVPSSGLKEKPPHSPPGVLIRWPSPLAFAFVQAMR